MVDLLQRLGKIPPKETQNVGTVLVDVQPSSIASKINNSYDAPKREIILNALTVSGFDKVVPPTDAELTYVSSVFQSKGLTNPDNVTFTLVSDVGRTEFSDLNNKLKIFTSKMSAVKTPGLFTLIDTLSQDIHKADLESIWERTTKAKPTVMARFKSLFNPSAEGESLNAQFRKLYDSLSEKGKGLEVKIGEIEGKLKVQKADQERNIKDLESSFQLYYESFIELRKQFIFIVYLEQSFSQQLESFKNSNSNTSDLTFNKKLQDYESVLTDIQNRRLLIHGALLKLPMTVKQNEQLILVCKNLLKEIDNTMQSSFPTIRSNIASLGIALNAQQGMIGTDSAKKLERHLQDMSMKVIGDLAVKSETLSSESRVSEAEAIRNLVRGLKEMDARLQTAKDQSKSNIETASNLLNESTIELKQILGQ